MWVDLNQGSLTYVHLRTGIPQSDVIAQLPRVYSAWGGRLVRRKRPSPTSPNDGLFVARLSETWLVIVSPKGTRDGVAAALAKVLRTSTLWQQGDSKYLGGYEIQYGNTAPPSRAQADLPLLAVFRLDGTPVEPETKKHAGLRATLTCQRRHRTTLDLTQQSTIDSAVEFPGAEEFAGPPFYKPLEEDLLGWEAGWLRIASPSSAQRVLGCWPCQECTGIGYAELFWEDGCFRSVRALRARPSKTSDFHVVFDPKGRDRASRGLRSRERARHRAEATRAARAEALRVRTAEHERGQPLTEAAIEAAIASEEYEPFVEVLQRGLKYGPAELAVTAVDKLFEYDQRLHDAGERPSGLNLSLLLDFGAGLTSRANAMVALQCVRLDLTESAERYMKAAAPLARDVVAELRRRAKRVPLGFDDHKRPQLTLLEQLIDTYSNADVPSADASPKAGYPSRTRRSPNRNT